MEFKLILKKINNTLEENERIIFDVWYNESSEHRIYFNRVKDHYSKGLDVVDIKKGWDGVSSKIEKKGSRKTYMKYVAAVVFFLGIGSLWLSHTEKIEVPLPNSSSEITENPIQIGTDKATLTLEDGSHITLEKGKSYKTGKASSNGEQLVYNSEEKLPKKLMAQNILTIPRGGQFFVVLADGTKVWINSETQLKYPVAFASNETRQVELVYGEAYFDVSPSSEHNGTHFIVKSEGQQVEVLGTEFNIKSYKGEDQVSTTLVEGKVRVENQSGSKSLTPGHQSRFNRNLKNFVVSKVDVYDEISWKEGLFSFKNRPLEDIMQVLSRWYDVDVVFQTEAIKKLTFNGVFRKTLKLDEILNIIKNTNEVNYEINKKTITMN
ncbi:FecR family protein [Kriegella aquimaris]|uniref:FecR family protein n=1 Tax=Kriegella aquimaris TaxID=192904 RepID=A0A1G9S6D6_9FLAO|nr:FecR domain-containing protein [Kriegella aquimaris]SDM31073.1 FecR family protein [Kriegella aquimaris]